MAICNGPLSSVRVLDFSEGVAGPFCTRLLAYFGAEVIKVERPGSGDPARNIPPFFNNLPGPDRGILFAYLNAGKRSLALDLEQQANREVVRQLVRRCDIVVESFPPGYLADRGLSADALRELRQALVVTSLPDVPRNSRYRDFQVTELNAYAMSGLMSLVGDMGKPPIKAGGYQANYMAGLHAAALTLFASYRARMSGIGSWIETSVVESAAKIFAHMVDYTEAGGETAAPDARRARTNAVLPCKDGFVTVTLYYFQMKELGELLGIPDLTSDPRFRSEDRVRTNERSLKDEVRRWLATRTADEAQAEAQSRHLLFTKVNDAKSIVESPHLRARRFLRWVEQGDGQGRVEYPGPPFILSETPAVDLTPAPRHGEANEWVQSLATGSMKADPGKTGCTGGDD